MFASTQLFTLGTWLMEEINIPCTTLSWFWVPCDRGWHGCQWETISWCRGGVKNANRTNMAAIQEKTRHLLWIRGKAIWWTCDRPLPGFWREYVSHNHVNKEVYKPINLFKYWRMLPHNQKRMKEALALMIRDINEPVMPCITSSAKFSEHLFS